MKKYALLLTLLLLTGCSGIVGRLADSTTRDRVSFDVWERWGCGSTIYVPAKDERFILLVGADVQRKTLAIIDLRGAVDARQAIVSYRGEGAPVSFPQYSGTAKDFDLNVGKKYTRATIKLARFVLRDPQVQGESKQGQEILEVKNISIPRTQVYRSCRPTPL